MGGNDAIFTEGVQKASQCLQMPRTLLYFLTVMHFQDHALEATMKQTVKSSAHAAADTSQQITHTYSAFVQPSYITRSP